LALFILTAQAPTPRLTHDACACVQVFGPDHMAAIYTSNSLALASGSYTFATGLAGHFYKTAKAPETEACIGRMCYLPTDVICAALCTTCAAACVLMARGTRKRYAQLYPEHITVR